MLLCQLHSRSESVTEHWYWFIDLCVLQYACEPNSQVPERAADDKSASVALLGGGRDDAKLRIGREEAAGAARSRSRAAHGVCILVLGPGHGARRGALPALRARRR